ncbi:MAG: hypothetical protein F6K35_25360 [Okeania sp. SIO2H7]|nr:hypothetical protein [Okeania sp. SIO2H7]
MRSRYHIKSVESIQELFEEASESGMSTRELRDYHFLFAEPVQVWSRTATEN